MNQKQKALFSLWLPEWYDRSCRRLELVRTALTILIGVLLARTHALFGAYPFALALLAAATVRVPALFVGAVGGALSMGAVGVVYTAVYAVVFFLRIALSYPTQGRRRLPESRALFGELPQLRFAVALLGGGLLTAYELLLFGPQTYVLFFGGAMLALPPLLCLLLLGCGDLRFGAPAVAPLREAEAAGGSPSDGGLRARTLWMAAGLLTLGVGLCRGLSGYAWFDISAGLLFAGAATLCAARRFGALGGGAAGLLLPLVIAPTVAPAFCLYGLCAGLFFGIGQGWGLCAAVAALGIYTGLTGGTNLFLSAVPEAALAAALVYPILARVGAARSEQRRRQMDAAVGADAAFASDAASAGNAADAADAARSAERGNATAVPSGASAAASGANGASAGRTAPSNDSGRIAGEDSRQDKLAEAFSALSHLFFAAAENAASPSSAEYLALCDEVFRPVCNTCERRAACWDSGDKPALAGLSRLSDMLHSRGVVQERQFGTLLEDCPSARSLLDEVRRRAAALREQTRLGDRSEFLALDYAMVSRLLDEAARHRVEEQTPDPRRSAGCADAIRLLGESSAAVYGTRRPRVIVAMHDAGTLRRNEVRLRRLLSEELQCPLGPAVYGESGGAASCTMTAARRFSARLLYRTSAAGGEVSGDLISSFETDEDYFYTLLSDGMGSGEGAAFTARLCTLFLEKMLAAGTEKATALKMLNNLIRAKGSECSATVDLMEFDLCTGKLAFIKSGAALSYVRRGGKLFRLCSRTAPIGLLRALDAEQILFEAEAGDTVFLFSDGVVPDGADCDWLAALLAEPVTDYGRLAEQILCEARSRTDRPDDMTVGIVMIDRAACGAASA